jgi:hypothetical protein
LLQKGEDMLDTNHKYQPCDFSETLVSYLYGEIEAAESRKFQAHIMQCGACSSELASFSGVRSSIAEWRQEEFAPMDAFAVELPARERPVILTDEPLASASSWLDSVRAFFTPQITIAAAGFAALLLFAGLLFVFWNMPRAAENDTLAKNTAPKQIELPAMNVNPVQNNVDKSETAKATVSPVENKQPEEKNFVTAPHRQTVTAKHELAAIPAPTVREPQISMRKEEAKNVKTTLPSHYEEDEDDSLRLADLFAEESN